MRKFLSFNFKHVKRVCGFYISRNFFLSHFHVFHESAFMEVLAMKTFVLYTRRQLKIIGFVSKEKFLIIMLTAETPIICRKHFFQNAFKNFTKTHEKKIGATFFLIVVSINHENVLLKLWKLNKKNSEIDKP